MSAYAGSGAATAARPLELLERALSWTRPVLAAVPGHPAATPTPCAAWDLADLLAHLVDGFTAFRQGASGTVSASAVTDLPRDPALLAGRLLDLGGGLLGQWVAGGRRPCVVGGCAVSAATLLEVAALEVAVHGWDVAQIVLPDRRLPPELAAALLPVALRRVAADDRPSRFGPVVVPAAGRDATSVLLGHLGRVAAPVRSTT